MSLGQEALVSILGDETTGRHGHASDGAGWALIPLIHIRSHDKVMGL